MVGVISSGNIGWLLLCRRGDSELTEGPGPPQPPATLHHRPRPSTAHQSPTAHDNPLQPSFCVFVHLPVMMRVAPVRERDHGDAMGCHGLTCGSVQGG